MFAILTLGMIADVQASFFLADTYEALGGNAAQDDLAEANEVLSDLVDLSKTSSYAAVVRNNAGSATWIGNSSTKSYFMTVAHVVNSASSNTLTTHNGTQIPAVPGSVLHTREGDFGLLEYNGLLDPELFGGQSLTMMDYDLVNNFSGYETTLVGYGNLTIGDRRLGRTRMLSRANLTRLDGQFRTQSTIPTTYSRAKPYAGVGTQGDSGGGVFLNLDGEDILIGANSAGNLVSGMVYTNIYQKKAFIDAIVPEGVFTWYSETQELPGLALGSTSFVDFGDASTVEAAGYDTYNTVGTSYGDGNSSPLSTGGGLAGLRASNILDSNGEFTSIDLTLTTYNAGDGQLRSNDSLDGDLSHNAVTRIEELAYNDGLWLNNHDSSEAGDDFGFVLTFSDLTGPAYDITLLVGSSNSSGEWAVTTGLGGAAPGLFNDDQDNVLTFQNVVPVDGQIVLTSTVTTTTGDFENQFISAAKLTSVLPLAGDFNYDGLVDIADYTVWRDNLEASGLAPYSAGDADGDGDVDLADYNLWQQNFGATATSANASANVAAAPEPNACVLILLAAAGVASGRRKSC